MALHEPVFPIRELVFKTWVFQIGFRHIRLCENRLGAPTSQSPNHQEMEESVFHSTEI